MTQEEKQLLLKDLCARLPYKPYVKVWLREGDTEQGFLTIEDNYDAVLRGFIDEDVIKIKLYLRPMSSMTDEEKKEYGKVCELDTEILSKHPMDETPFPALYNSQDWLNEHHFDYRGLIPMGLALEAPEGMYKTE